MKNNNIRKIIDNLLLLEDLLFHKEKQCKRCIKEKFLFIEKLLENVIESDSNKDLWYYPVIFPILDKIREVQKKYPKLTQKDLQSLRKTRKKIMNQCFKVVEKDKEKLKKKVNHKCKADLLPILDVEFNIREAVKNMLLLEDHLLDKRRRCMDCCKKNMLLLEEFLEEGITLDKKGKYVKELEKNSKIVRNLQKKLLEGRKNYFDIAMEIRKMRRKMFDRAFEFVKKC
jgi:molecular chaperone GrpE (heat shock protein)